MHRFLDALQLARRVITIFIIGGVERVHAYVAVTFLNVVYFFFLAIYRVSNINVCGLGNLLPSAQLHLHANSASCD